MGVGGRVGSPVDGPECFHVPSLHGLWFSGPSVFGPGFGGAGFGNRKEPSAMEPFQIVCPSCQGKLRVAKESLLGRTIPCPRCSQPVEVVDPRRVFVRPPGGEALDSEAITRGADESLEGAAPHAKAESLAPQMAGKRGFRNDPASVAPSIPPSPTPTPAPQSKRQPSDDRAIDPAAQVAPLELPQNWSADGLNSSRRWLQAITLGLIGLLAAGAGFFGFVRLFQNQQNKGELAVAPHPSKARKLPASIDRGVKTKSSPSCRHRSLQHRP
jgi:hypothetical protein